MILAISVCTYQDGKFEVLLRDAETNQEVTLSGVQKLGAEDFDFVNRIAPACLWTEYKSITPGV